jgi:hypothetical protein
MADPVKPRPIADIIERKIVSFVETYCNAYAEEAEQYAKANKPWTNRTGMARKLMKGIVLDGSEASFAVFSVDKDGKSVEKGTVVIKDSADRIGFALAHRVDYGKYLEEANSGKYAVLKPTLEHLKSKFIADARAYFGGKK